MSDPEQEKPVGREVRFCPYCFQMTFEVSQVKGDYIFCPRKHPRGGHPNFLHRDALVASPAFSAGGGSSLHFVLNCWFCASRSQKPPPQTPAGRLPKHSPLRCFGIATLAGECLPSIFKRQLSQLFAILAV